jgi:hypothetical protein
LLGSRVPSVAGHRCMYPARSPWSAHSSHGESRMKVAKHWKKVERPTVTEDGQHYRLLAWGGSAVSDDDAQRQAEEKLNRWLAKLARGEQLDEYEYQIGELREELLEEVQADSGELIGAVTRNRYGSLVLNTQSIFIADIDAETPNWWTKLCGMFGRKLRDKQHHLERTRDYVRGHPDSHAIVYETRAGLRIFLTHRNYDPHSDESQQLLTQLGSDHLYRTLCSTQQCYRARLSPKPWRIGLPRARVKFPRETAEQQREFERWRDSYEKHSSQFGVCRELARLGEGTITDEAQRLLGVHDRYAVSATQAELA